MDDTTTENQLDNVRCVKIRRQESHGENFWCICGINHSLADEFDGAEVGERVEIEYCEMSKAEFDALPDFPGW